MAAFDIQTRHSSIFRITDNVSEAHDVTNNTPSVMMAGVIVTVTANRKYPTQHLDADTTVLVRPGQTVTIDPTGVAAAVGIGFLDTTEQNRGTAENYVVA